MRRRLTVSNCRPTSRLWGHAKSLQQHQYESPALSGNTRGIGLVFVSTLGRTALHALVRLVSAELHPFQVAFFQNFFGLFVVLPWFIRRGLAPLRTNSFSTAPAACSDNARLPARVVLRAQRYAVGADRCPRIHSANFHNTPGDGLPP